jgi:hypothetical protein
MKGIIMKNVKVINDIKKHLRAEREKICFPIINRGKLWYDTLTFDQLVELKRWYWDWLDVTDTNVVPVTPSWLKDKIVQEEGVL